GQEDRVWRGPLVQDSSCDRLRAGRHRPFGAGGKAARASPVPTACVCWRDGGQRGAGCHGRTCPRCGSPRAFVEAQEGVYERALGELRAGLKRGHWMWFVFPQLRGLGRSAQSAFYGEGAERSASRNREVLTTQTD